MITVQIARLFRLGLALVLLGGTTAQAFTLFPTAKNRAASQLKRADRLLSSADAAYERGDPAEAREFYASALSDYEELNRTAPDLHDGLPSYRVNYCKGQLASVDQQLAGNTGAAMQQGAQKAGAFSGAFSVDDSAQLPPRQPAKPQALRIPQPSRGALAPSDTIITRHARQGTDGELAARKALDGEPVTRTVAGRQAAAAPVADDAIKSLPDEPARPPVDPKLVAADLQEARLMLEDDQLADATRILVQVLREDPGNRSARLMLGIARTRQGRSDEALVTLEDLRGQNEDLPLLLALSGAYCQEGRYFDAMLTLDKAITLAPSHPHAYLNLAWLHLAMNAGTESKRDAEAYYRRAVKLGARRDRALELKLGIE
jgi:tetratricopeptide (TPR) repeat protein